jgi:hypothetical protein
MDWSRPDPPAPSKEPVEKEPQYTAAEQAQIQRLQAVRNALVFVASNQAWAVLCDFADHTIYELEQKALREDNDVQANVYRYDARGARKFWEKWLKLVEIAKSSEVIPGEYFNEVVM